MVSWVIGLLRERRSPDVPPALTLGIAFLIAMMWIGIGNASALFDVAAGHLIAHRSLRFLPSNVDARNALPSAVCLSAILLALAVTADLGMSITWRQRFLAALGWTGCSVIVGGLLLRAGAFPTIEHFLSARPWSQGDAFGPIDYHGNVATLINLSIPAAAWEAARARSMPKSALATAALGILLVAAAVNSSRAGLIFAFVSAVILAWLVGRKWLSGHGIAGTPRLRRWMMPGLALGCVVAIGTLTFSGAAQSVSRLRTLRAEVMSPWNARYLQDHVAWQMAQDRPWFGGGVGSYKLLVQQSPLAGRYLAGRFHPGDPFTVLNHHVQNDYLQTLVEWGWVGLAGWGIVVGGSVQRLWKIVQSNSRQSFEPLVVAAALGVVYLHAMIDCPLEIAALQLYTAVYLGLAYSIHGRGSLGESAHAAETGGTRAVLSAGAIIS